MVIETYLSTNTKPKRAADNDRRSNPHIPVKGFAAQRTVEKIPQSLGTDTITKRHIGMHTAEFAYTKHTIDGHIATHYLAKPHTQLLGLGRAGSKEECKGYCAKNKS